MAKVDIQQVDLSSVSAAWGDEITHKAERALVFFFIALTIYISIRFEWKMAIAAIVAVVHDVLISVGIYSIFGFEVSPATVIAFLTILGYSLYDTIVVFDKVHDNTKRLSTAGKSTYGDIVNLSMNQVLMRSLNTSLAAVLPVLSLLVVGSGIMGAHALQDFALALFVGLITGSYSSIYVATPILAALKEREPRYQAIRQRVGRTSGDINVLRMTGSARPANLGVSAASAGGTTAARPSGSVPPRPRKKKRR
jgi:preprotein translocase subunit SecF